MRLAVGSCDLATDDGGTVNYILMDSANTTDNS
jgi:hypothetical protein